MMKNHIYLDTSVIGGYYDIEFEIPTKQLFDRIIKKNYIVYLSEITETELFFAPAHIKEVKSFIPKDCINYIEINKETEFLAQKYISEKILGKASENDAYHIALSTVFKIDCLISWNFKHIVNFDKINSFNSINKKLGYPLITICSPIEFLRNEK